MPYIPGEFFRDIAQKKAAIRADIGPLPHVPKAIREDFKSRLIDLALYTGKSPHHLYRWVWNEFSRANQMPAQGEFYA